MQQLKIEHKNKIEKKKDRCEGKSRVLASIKCRSCSYQFDPTKEGNSRRRKCGMCCFGDSYSVRSKKEYKRELLFAIIESQSIVGKE